MRNHCLDRLFELNFSNIFKIDVIEKKKMHDLIIKHFEFIHQKNWFRKIMIDVVTVFVVVATIINLKKNFAKILIFSLFIANFFAVVFSSKTILSNEIIIYDFNSDEIVRSLRQMMKFFFNLWNDIEFVIVKIKNWMKISFKTDWKIKVSKKTKIYSFDQKNWNFVNDIFN